MLRRKQLLIGGETDGKAGSPFSIRCYSGLQDLNSREVAGSSTKRIWAKLLLCQTGHEETPQPSRLSSTFEVTSLQVAQKGTTRAAIADLRVALRSLVPLWS